MLTKFYHIDSISRISFIGFSLGGLIIRAALPRLRSYRHLFHTYLSIATPHLGLKYSQKLISTALSILNVVREVPALQEMRLADLREVGDCYLYRLSKYEGLNWFKHVYFMASQEDKYAPYRSASVQLS